MLDGGLHGDAHEGGGGSQTDDRGHCAPEVGGGAGEGHEGRSHAKGTKEGRSGVGPAAAKLTQQQGSHPQARTPGRQQQPKLGGFDVGDHFRHPHGQNRQGREDRKQDRELNQGVADHGAIEQIAKPVAQIFQDVGAFDRVVFGGFAGFHPQQQSTRDRVAAAN